MKKIYIVLLMLLIMFIPTSINAVAIYQLDQPVSSLNGYTLREVFEDSDLLTSTWEDRASSLHTYIFGNLVVTALSDSASIGVQQPIVYEGYHYINIELKSDSLNLFFIGQGNISITIKENDTYQQNSIKAFYSSDNLFRIYQSMLINQTFTINRFILIDMEYYGIQYLTVEQMDTYYDLYLEAVRYEQENKEAVKDEGNYKHIFMSIYEGLTNLMKSMGSVWTFLSTPIINSNITEMGQLFNIDWSWNIFDIFRQLITDLALFVLQLNTYIVSSLFFALGIPIKISILSLVFSDFVFVVLTWIIFKSFII